MRRYLAQIEFSIEDTPCLIGVLHYETYTPAYTHGPPERCASAEGGYGDYELLDRNGDYAPGLAKKVTRKYEEMIQDAIFDCMEEL